MEPGFKYLKLGLNVRLAAAAALYAGAAAVQIAARSTLAGVPLVLATWLLLALKPASNRPKDKGLEEWRAVTGAEVSRIADTIAQSRKLRVRILGPTVLKYFILIVMLFVAFTVSAAAPGAGLAVADFCLFLVPGLFFGKVTTHLPFEFDLKLARFVAIMNVARPDGFVLTPYLRFDKDDQGRDVPEDLRLLLEPKRKAADLVGVQFQASINKGANGNVPYMYAVVLTKGTGGQSYARFRSMRAAGFEVESGGDADYGTVVVRQETSGGGYHTTNDDCVRLMELMIKSLQRLEPAS
jgi:hypothetical protein